MNRRAGVGLLVLALAAAGMLAAAVLGGTVAIGADTTDTSSTATGPVQTVTDTFPTTTVTSTTVPATVPPTTHPKPKPAPQPKATPKPKPKHHVQRQPARLPARVTIGGVHVGGLSPVAAYQAVRIAFASPLYLGVGVDRFSVSPGRLGASAYVKAAVRKARTAEPGAKIPLHVAVRGDDVRAYVSGLAPRVDAKPVDAKLVLKSLRPFVTESKLGRQLDQLKAVRTITYALSTNRRALVRLPVVPLKPKVVTDGFGPVVVIRRSSNRLYLYSGARFVRRFGVATGQSIYPTPLGRFHIVVKWENPWWYPPASPWAKGLKPVPPGPGNPLGTRWMGLSTPGVGIHGTPDSASIGYSASHGCIRMLIPDAEWLFQHVEIGTPVFIVSA